jgi:hypothetical protein
VSAEVLTAVSVKITVSWDVALSVTDWETCASEKPVACIFKAQKYADLGRKCWYSTAGGGGGGNEDPEGTNFVSCYIAEDGNLQSACCLTVDQQP